MHLTSYSSQLRTSDDCIGLESSLCIQQLINKLLLLLFGGHGAGRSMNPPTVFRDMLRVAVERDDDAVDVRLSSWSELCRRATRQDLLLQVCLHSIISTSSVPFIYF